MKKFLYIFLFLLVFTGCNNRENDNSKNEKKAVILVYGLPARGKLTVAKELSKKYNLHLMDNHFFNNIIFPYVNLNDDTVVAMYPDINKIRKIWIDNVVKYGKRDKGFVFTDVLISSKAVEKGVKDIEKFADKLGYKFLPVKLICNEEDIKKRIDNIERKKRHKLVDFKLWKNYIDKTEFLDVKNSLVINNIDIKETLKIIDSKL